MAELVFSTDVFRPLGRPMPGVPMLLDGEMRLVEPACAWLLHIALVRGRTRSPQTWRAYGEALYDWWQTLEANGWAWDRVSFHEVAAYRDRMLGSPSGHTGRPYARATINGRLRIVAPVLPLVRRPGPGRGRAVHRAGRLRRALQAGAVPRPRGCQRRRAVRQPSWCCGRSKPCRARWRPRRSAASWRRSAPATASSWSGPRSPACGAWRSRGWARRGCASSTTWT